MASLSNLVGIRRLAIDESEGVMIKSLTLESTRIQNLRLTTDAEIKTSL